MSKIRFVAFIVIVFCITGELFAQNTWRRIRREVRRERAQLREWERDASRAIDRTKRSVEEKAEEKVGEDFHVLSFLREFQGIGADPTEKPGMNLLRQLLASNPKNAGDLHPVYSVSMQNLSDLDEALSNMSRAWHSEEFHADFESSTEFWGEDFLDADRSAGFVLLTDGRLTYPMVFMPLKPGPEAANTFFTTFGRVGQDQTQADSGKIEIHETSRFRWAELGKNPYIRLPAETIVLQKEDWGYILPRSMLHALPEDPRVYLPHIDGTYLVSDDFRFEGFPRRLGNLMLNIGEVAVRFSDPNKAKLGPEQKEILSAGLDFARVLVNESRSLFRGVKIDDATGDVILETAWEVVPGGRLSGYFQRQSVREATVASFYRSDEALFAVLVSEELNPPQKQIAHALIRYVFRDLRQRMQTEQELRAAENATESVAAAVREPQKPHQNENEEETARNPREIAGSFAGAVSRYLGETWDSSFSAVFESTKDHLELEFLKNMQTILHENVEQGLLNVAVTTKPDGNTFGAIQILGGTELTAILAAAQLKISTDRHSAALRGKVRLNHTTFEEHRVSSIIMPIKEIKGTGNLPPSLREETLHLYLAIKEDRFCFAFGRDAGALEELKNAIRGAAVPHRIPSRTLVLSPCALGRLLEPYTEEMRSETTPRAIRTLLQADPDSRLSYEIAYTPQTYRSILRVPEALWSAVGQLTAKQALEKL